jgi:UDP-N-acetylmuramyl tripeptide synthase
MHLNRQTSKLENSIIEHLFVVSQTSKKKEIILFVELIHGAMTSLANDNSTQQQQPIKLIHVSFANKGKTPLHALGVEACQKLVIVM